MKIKDYSKFQFLRGRIFGIADGTDNQEDKKALLEIADKLEKLFIEFFQITPTIPVKKEEEIIKPENRVGAVTRPSVEKVNKTKQQQEEEEAFEEAFEK